MNWQMIVGGIFLLGGFGGILEDFFNALIMLLIGASLLYWGIKKKKGTRSGKTNEKPEIHESRTLHEDDFHATGVGYYEKNIKKLENKNPEWSLSAAAVVEKGKTDKKIFRYNYVNKPVKLVPEPDNPHDKDAIAIYIAGELVGYIGQEDTHRVHNILKHCEIVAISGFIGGGEYKIISDSKDVFKSSMGNTVNVRIRYF